MKSWTHEMICFAVHFIFQLSFPNVRFFLFRNQLKLPKSANSKKNSSSYEGLQFFSFKDGVRCARMYNLKEQQQQLV
jgi:hypothetical protein